MKNVIYFIFKSKKNKILNKCHYLPDYVLNKFYQIC